MEIKVRLWGLCLTLGGCRASTDKFIAEDVLRDRVLVATPKLSSQFSSQQQMDLTLVSDCNSPGPVQSPFLSKSKIKKKKNLCNIEKKTNTVILKPKLKLLFQNKQISQLPNKCLACYGKCYGMGLQDNKDEIQLWRPKLWAWVIGE